MLTIIIFWFISSCLSTVPLHAASRTCVLSKDRSKIIIYILAFNNLKALLYDICTNSNKVEPFFEIGVVKIVRTHNMNELLKCRRVSVSKAVFTETSSSRTFLNFPTENITTSFQNVFYWSINLWGFIEIIIVLFS